MRSKTYQAIKGKSFTDPVAITTAVEFLKNNARQSFDETVEIHVCLGVDASKSEQMVRGTVTLPSGLPKEQKIVVFTDDTEQQKQAIKAGAINAGGEELIDQITKDNKLDADVTIAIPGMMIKVARAAKILGPKGLMPNPKTNTVTPDPISTLHNLLGGQTSFKMDKQGNVHLAIAKLSWPVAKTIANAEAFLQALSDSRPAAAKGQFMHSVTIKSTMSPAIRLSNS